MNMSINDKLNAESIGQLTGFCRADLVETCLCIREAGLRLFESGEGLGEMLHFLSFVANV